MAGSEWRAAKAASAAMATRLAAAEEELKATCPPAVATRLAAAEEEVKATVAAAAAEMKQVVERGREVLDKRLKRDLSDRGINLDDLDEYDCAEEMFSFSGGDEPFPEWMHQSVEAESPFEKSTIPEACEWVSNRREEDGD